MARYGRVTFSISYVVDLDDAEMIDEAREMLAEDICDAESVREAVRLAVVQDAHATEADIHDTLIQWRDERRAERREHYGTLDVSADVADKVQAIVDGPAMDCGRDECVFDREVVFDDGCRMAIQAVVNNDLEGGWMQGVLFSPEGTELGCTDVGDRLAGEYSVAVDREDGTHTYTVDVASSVAAE